MFNSNDSLVAKRTSYSVFNADIPRFQNHLIVNFDLSLWDNKDLGYIFNLTGANNTYSLSYLYFNNAAYLNFNIDRKSNKLKIPLRPEQLKKQEWLKVKVDFDLQADKVVIYIGNHRYQANGLGLENPIAGKLIFGKNQFYTEVPDMAIKNLTVSDDSKSYSFPLNEWKGRIVHDAAGDETGTVDNPVWLINESYFWKPIYNRQFNEVAGLNFDPNNQQLLIYRRDSLIQFDSEQCYAGTTPYKSPLPIPLLLGKSIFNAKQNKCYLYEAYIDNKNLPSAVATLDMQSLQWQSLGKAMFPQQRHHHNTIFNKAQDTIFLFGGYGSYYYYNAFYKYDPGADKWEKVAFTGDNITPRFFSAMGKADNDNEVFLFGGYGNESGSQIVGGRQYYDLYRINLQTHVIKKCWNIHPGEIFVPANNLVLSKDKKYFYALCYPHEIAKTELRLYKFSVKDGSYQIVSAPIAVTSERIESDINLFLNERTNQLLCAIQEFSNNINSTIKIYSLAFPPVAEESYLRSLKAPASVNLIYLLIAIVILVLLIAAVIFILRKRRREAIISVQSDSEIFVEQESGSLHEAKNEMAIPNAAYLLGEFMVYNKKGRDITYLFSPKIKQLFILILLNSKERSGIASKKISQLLWPDKDVTKTKNIKGVTFNHLRNIISDIDGIELAFSNDIYQFNITDSFFCDYFQVLDTLKKTDAAETLISGQFDLINRGLLLNDMTDTWLDDFKLSYDEQLIDAILPWLQELYAAENYKTALEISRIILNIDPFNDAAVKYQLKSYRRLKGIDYSKKIYDQYAADYKKSLGIDYPISLDKILQ